MKKVLKIIAILAFCAFALIQFSRPERVNLPIDPNETLEASMNVPSVVSEIFTRSCNDCHTNNTNWTWYSNIAPISWGMVDHVNEGREKLNFSKWSTYNLDRKIRKLDEICEEVKAGQMPHNQYLWLHWDATLTAEDVKQICDWTKIEYEKLSNSNTVE